MIWLRFHFQSEEVTCRHAGPEILIIAIAALPGAVESAYIVESAPNATDGDDSDNSSIIEEAL